MFKNFRLVAAARRIVHPLLVRFSPRARAASLLGSAILVLAVVVAYSTSRSPAASSPSPTAAATTDAAIVLTPEQQKSVGIVVSALRESSLAEIFRAPATVQTNDYTSGTVAPRVAASVISRAAKLGDRVAAGQKLVTLYSKDMAEAQSAYILAARDLARFQRLSNFVAARELDEAATKSQEAYGRLVSYGLTPAQIKELLSRGVANGAMGQFDLVSPKSGAITRDEFVVGQVIEPGKTLFEIADQRDVWVEAYVSPALAKKIGGETGVVIAGDVKRSARVVQIRETVDDATRTIGVRLQVDNADGALKPGQFVDVELYGRPQSVTAVPTGAVLRNEDGSWSIYIENRNGSFSPRKVKSLFITGDQIAIGGLAQGTRVVTSGAFFVQSEGDKASFGDE